MNSVIDDVCIGTYNYICEAYDLITHYLHLTVLNLSAVKQYQYNSPISVLKQNELVP